jgi:hypothetical protein
LFHAHGKNLHLGSGFANKKINVTDSRRRQNQSLWTFLNLDLMGCWRSYVTEPMQKSPIGECSAFGFLPDLAHGRFQRHPFRGQI